MPTTHSLSAVSNQEIPHHYVDRLQLNTGKTDFMWCVPPRRRHQLPADQLTVQSASIAPVESVRDLGITACILTAICHAAHRFLLQCSTSTAQASLPRRELDRVQSVVTAAARLSADARRTTTWHRSWWTFTGCGCRNASNTSVVEYLNTMCI